jgi:hypothetical protein
LTTVTRSGLPSAWVTSVATTLSGAMLTSVPLSPPRKELYVHCSPASVVEKPMPTGSGAYGGAVIRMHAPEEPGTTVMLTSSGVVRLRAAFNTTPYGSGGSRP